MYYFEIFIIASWNLLLPASSDNLFSLDNFDDIIWDTMQATVDDSDSGIGLINLSDPLPFDDDDDDDALFANIPSPNTCAAAEANDRTLEGRNDQSSCQTEKKEFSPILSPESLQIFQDPIPLLSNPSTGFQKPPNPSEPPLFPVFLPNGQETDLERTLWEMELRQNDKSFYCLTGLRKVPICCDGPLSVPNMLENCDEGKEFLIPLSYAHIP